MTQLNTFTAKSGAALAALGAASLLAACGSSGSGNHSASASGTPASDHALEISIHSGHLSGAGGRALYLWDADRHNHSNCHGACATAWPPLVLTSKPKAGHGVKASDIGLIARHGSQRQVTYDGHPLYYFAGDSGRSTNGQGSRAFGAAWWLVAPSGAAITSHSSSKSSSTGGGSSSGGW